MHVIAFAASKGGVGKTTLASSLAVRAARDCPKVAMVDLDPQKSLSGWYERRGDGNSENPFLYRGTDLLPDAVEELRDEGWEIVIVDTPPAGLELLAHNLQVADLILIPVKASAYDLEAVMPVAEICQVTERPYLCVLNDIRPNSKLARSAAELLGELELPVAECTIAHREAYAASATVGKAAPEIERDGKAAAEIDALWDVIRRQLGLKKRAGRRG